MSESPDGEHRKDPTAVPVVLLVQLFLQRLPVVTHVFSKETGLAKTRAADTRSETLRPVTTRNGRDGPNEASSERGLKEKRKKQLLMALGAVSCILFQTIQKAKTSLLFILSPWNH